MTEALDIKLQTRVYPVQCKSSTCVIQYHRANTQPLGVYSGCDLECDFLDNLLTLVVCRHKAREGLTEEDGPGREDQRGGWEEGREG